MFDGMAFHNRSYPFCIDHFDKVVARIAEMMDDPAFAHCDPYFWELRTRSAINLAAAQMGT